MLSQGAPGRQRRSTRRASASILPDRPSMVHSSRPMSEKRLFTYAEALEAFPRVRERTHAAVRAVEAVYNSLESREEAEERSDEIQQEIEGIVTEWMEEIVELGCEVKGLWLVDWDNGDGYYCWRYPEETLGYYHSYEDGFAGRVPIA